MSKSSMKSKIEVLESWSSTYVVLIPKKVTPKPEGVEFISDSK